MSNLLYRLPNPIPCLLGLPKITNPNCTFLSTSYRWIDQLTLKENCQGRYNDENMAVCFKDALLKVMEQIEFEKIHGEHVP